MANMLRLYYSKNIKSIKIQNNFNNLDWFNSAIL